LFNGIVMESTDVNRLANVHCNDSSRLLIEFMMFLSPYINSDNLDTGSLVDTCTLHVNSIYGSLSKSS